MDKAFKEFYTAAYEDKKNNFAAIKKIKKEIFNKLKIEFKEKFCLNCEILNIKEIFTFDVNIKKFEIKFKKNNKINYANIIIDINKSEGKIIIDEKTINIIYKGKNHGK